MDTSSLTLGRRAMALIEELAQYTDEPGRLTRLYLSPAHREAAEATRRMMQAAGLSAHIDAAGSVVGRIEGANPGAPALLIGSHIDSVVDAGRFDGNLGVVLGIVAAQALGAEGGPACPIEVVAFGDEENVRFPLEPLDLLRADRPLQPRLARRSRRGRHHASRGAAALRRRSGGDRLHRAQARRYRAYLEVHIEQGPQLEAADLPVGVVSAINGITRARAHVTGEAGMPAPCR
jgi:allantoate deiminase